MERYEELRVLGRGTFGVARLVRERGASGGQTCCRAGQLRVIKEVDLSGLPDVAARADAENEAVLMRGLSHPHIITCYDAFVEFGRLHIVMDYADGGDIAVLVASRRASGSRFSRTEALRILAQCASALRYIHSKHILHRDVKTQNIFATEGGILKLGDFGIAKVLANTAALAQTAVGTPFYLAPEVCDSRPYGSMADMWSLGVVFHEVLALELPFHANGIAALVVKIVTCEPRALPADLADDLRDMATRLLRKDPCDRPSASDLLAMPALRGLPAQALTLGAAASRVGLPLPARALNRMRDSPGGGPATPSASASPSCWAGFAAVLRGAMSPGPSPTTPTAAATLTPCARLLASVGVGGSPTLAATALTPYERLLGSLSASPAAGAATPKAGAAATSPGTGATPERGLQTPTLRLRRKVGAWDVPKASACERPATARSPTQSPSDSLDGLLAMLQDTSPPSFRTSAAAKREPPSVVLLGRTSPSIQPQVSRLSFGKEPAPAVTSPKVPASWESPSYLARELDGLSPPRVAWEFPSAEVPAGSFERELETVGSYERELDTIGSCERELDTIGSCERELDTDVAPSGPAASATPLLQPTKRPTAATGTLGPSTSTRRHASSSLGFAGRLLARRQPGAIVVE